MKQKLLWLITLLVLLAVCFPALGEEQAPSLTPNTEEIILAAGRRTQVPPLSPTPTARRA